MMTQATHEAHSMTGTPTCPYCGAPTPDINKCETCDDPDMLREE